MTDVLADPPRDLNGYDPIASAAAGDWYDPLEARRRVDFFEKGLRHATGRWHSQPFLLEAWQRDYVASLFGWKRADGTRRYRRSLLACGRKQGKTNLAAGIANSCLFQDGEKRAEVYCTAFDREQAGILYDAASAQVEQCPALRKLCRLLPSRHRILYRRNNSTLTALPASDKGGHGASTHCVVYDELHLYKSPRHVELYQSLHTSTANREQPLELVLSTAGSERTTLYWEELEHARHVASGAVDDRALLPLIYEAAADADWTSPDVWRTACPNLGVTITEEFLAEKVAEALQNPRLENLFRRDFLNQWTSQTTRWLSMSDFDECWGTPGGFADGEHRCGGLDLSATQDLTAYVQVARLPGGGLRCRGHYWAPQERLREMAREGLPVARWVRDGWMTPIPGAVIDDDYIIRHVQDDADRGGLAVVGYDPAHANQLRLRLEDRGLTMVAIRQGAYTLGEACKQVEKAIRSHTLDHGGDPVLAWCAENVETKSDDNGNFRPVKPPHGSKLKIDAVSALVTGLTAAIRTPDPVVSPYETPGAMTL